MNTHTISENITTLQRNLIELRKYGSSEEVEAVELKIDQLQTQYVNQKNTH